MADNGLPTKVTLEIVTPEGLLLREEVDEVIAPGEDGYFGVLPGHTPFLSTLGIGEIAVFAGASKYYLTCFWGFCEVLPDRVNILAELGERAEAIDLARAEKAKERAEAGLKAIRDEAGYEEARVAYVKAVTRLAVAKKRGA
jgi:F-type H+-transporting ATPase subunit epsilon